jgi:PIN domain nuclease of toxin-antitoxin system
VRVLLDTVTLIWALLCPEQLSRRAVAALEKADIREISAISLSELAIQHGIGKIKFNAQDARDGIADLQLHVLPYSAAHAWELFRLPLHHGDPFDRQIIAQAVAEDIPIITSDAKFKLYKEVSVIW